MAKILNISIGVLFLMLGLFGVFFPETVGEYYGWSYQTLQSKTQLRVLLGSFAGIGCLLIYLGYQCADQRPVLFALAILNISYILPRVVGLVVDGLEQPLIMYELLFEVSLLLVIRVLFKTESQKLGH